MQKNLNLKAILVAVPFLFCTSAFAQMAVHAVSGTVKAINDNSKTIDVATDGGSAMQFKIASGSKADMDFDHDLRSATVDAGKFHGVGNFVIVYYYGFGDDRTAVAIKDLGQRPLQKVTGTVVSFNKQDDVLTVRDKSGASHTFALNDQVIVDMWDGVDTGKKYEPHKGHRVRVTYSTAGTQSVPVFIRTLG
ncbi:MAG TPA: hypothetical protein VH351_05415 [Bryobacteraceae bacterium]|jgi:hypothetical protein|nr:hypothetical protein [Bryobacteraceae bacterium]